MNSFRDVVSAFGGPADFAEAIGGHPPTVRAWIHRESIPSSWWNRIVRAAQARGLDEVTNDLLATLAEPDDAAA